MSALAQKVGDAAAAGAQGPTQLLKQQLQNRVRSASVSSADGKSSSSDTSWCTDAFLQEIPKTDLHVHLDGSLRLETLIELAADSGVQLPSTDAAELRRTVFKKSYQSLEDYLTCFMYTVGVLQSAANLERAAYEFAVDNYREGVR